MATEAQLRKLAGYNAASKLLSEKAKRITGLGAPASTEYPEGTIYVDTDADIAYVCVDQAGGTWATIIG